MLTTDRFAQVASWLAERGGYPGLRFVVLDHPLRADQADAIAAAVLDAVPRAGASGA